MTSSSKYTDEEMAEIRKLAEECKAIREKNRAAGKPDIDPQVFVDALNEALMQPKKRAEHLAWLEYLGPESLSGVALTDYQRLKADFEQFRAEYEELMAERAAPSAAPPRG